MYFRLSNDLGSYCEILHIRFSILPIFFVLSNVCSVSAAISPILCIRIWIRPLSEILSLVNIVGFSVSLIILRKFEDKSSNLLLSNPDIEDIAENKSYDYRMINIKPQLNLPQNDVETAQIISQLNGKLSIQTGLERLSFITNGKAEFEKMLEEQKLMEQNSMASLDDIDTDTDDIDIGDMSNITGDMDE